MDHVGAGASPGKPDEGRAPCVVPLCTMDHVGAGASPGKLEGSAAVADAPSEQIVVSVEAAYEDPIESVHSACVLVKPILSQLSSLKGHIEHPVRIRTISMRFDAVGFS